MNKKLLIALVAVVTVVVSIASIAYLSQQIAVKYNGKLTLVEESHFPGDLQLWFYTGNILYNCKVTITYTATNGSQVIINQNIGTVDSNSQPLMHRIWLTDYPMQGTTVKEFTESDHLDNLEIKAYGYLSPYVS
jgi:hypothetical protein